MVAPNPALSNFLKSIPLFSLVAEEEMFDLLRLLRPMTLEAGEVLFREGAPGDSMWVLEGTSEVSISTTQGASRPLVVASAAAGETVGEMALVDDGPRSATAVVTQGGKAHQIQAMDFHVLRGNFSPAAFKVLRRICRDLCTKLRATNDRIVPPSGKVPSSPGVIGGPRPDPGVLDEFAPFHPLPKVVKLALAQKLRLVEVDQVTPLFAEGEEADAAYFVLSGEVTVGRNGRSLAHLGPGSMIGLVASIDRGRRSASCVTTGAARLLRLTDADFDALFSAGNRFAFHIVELVARQLVTHLRDANQLLPKGARSIEPKAALPDEEFLPQGEVLPLEFEIELDEPLAVP